MAAFADAISKNRRHMIDGLRLYDYLRDISIRAGVGGVANQVADAMPHKVLAKYSGQISLKLFRSSANKRFVDSIRAGGYIWTADAEGIR
jgi:hypothetical protein